WRVPSLSLPDPGRWVVGSLGEEDPGDPTTHQPNDPTTLLHSGAVQLFVQRASAAKPAFALTAENAGTVAQICRRLDGIPLGLELAAARLRALSLEQVAANRDDRFRLLTRGSRTALPRQQTLRATMDWSYYLLTGPEQALLRRVSVFAGSFTLEEAEAVCTEERVGVGKCGRAGVEPRPDSHQPTTHSVGTRGYPPTSWVLAIRPHDVLDLLTSLVDRSLVAVE